MDIRERQDDKPDVAKAFYIAKKLTQGIDDIFCVYAGVMDDDFDPSEFEDRTFSGRWHQTIGMRLNLAWANFSEVTHTLKRLSPESRRVISDLVVSEARQAMEWYDEAAAKYDDLDWYRDGSHGFDNMAAYYRLQRMIEIVQSDPQANPE